MAEGGARRRAEFVPNPQERQAFDLIANTVSGASLHGVSARMGLSMLRAKEVIAPMVRRRWLKRVAGGAVYEATPAGRAWLAAQARPRAADPSPATTDGAPDGV